MELQDRVITNLKKRRENLLSGHVNSIPSPFPRFSDDFIGLEQATSYLISSFTKGGKTQFILNLLFEALLYAINNSTVIRLKVFYFVLEETPDRLMERFLSWLLFKLDKIRISPKDLRSSRNKAPLSQEILNLLESEKYIKYINFFEETFIFSTTSNPTGILKECENYAKKTGITYTKSVTFSESQVFDYYVPNDADEWRIIVVDHISLIDSERGLNKKESIDRLSEYLSKTLRNRYKFSTVIIQQQSAEMESNDSFKLQRIRPSGAGLSDSKYPARDVDMMFGLFSPFKFGLKEYLGYDITKFKDTIRFLEVCVNRSGELGGIVPLFFDGATNYFTELPLPTDVTALNKVYAYIDTMRGNKLSTNFIIYGIKHKINNLFKFKENVKNIDISKKWFW